MRKYILLPLLYRLYKLAMWILRENPDLLKGQKEYADRKFLWEVRQDLKRAGYPV